MLILASFAVHARFVRPAPIHISLQSIPTSAVRPRRETSDWARRRLERELQADCSGASQHTRDLPGIGDPGLERSARCALGIDLRATQHAAHGHPDRHDDSYFQTPRPAATSCSPVGTRSIFPTFSACPFPSECGSLANPAAGFPLSLRFPATIRVWNRRAGVLLCYEQLAFWPAVETMARNPEMLIAPSNLYWARNTSIPAIQHLAAQDWADLWAIPALRGTESMKGILPTALFVLVS